MEETNENHKHPLRPQSHDISSPEFLSLCFTCRTHIVAIGLCVASKIHVIAGYRRLHRSSVVAFCNCVRSGYCGQNSTTGPRMKTPNITHWYTLNCTRLVRPVVLRIGRSMAPSSDRSMVQFLRSSGCSVVQCDSFELDVCNRSSLRSDSPPACGRGYVLRCNATYYCPSMTKSANSLTRMLLPIGHSISILQLRCFFVKCLRIFVLLNSACPSQPYGSLVRCRVSCHL